MGTLRLIFLDHGALFWWVGDMHNPVWKAPPQALLTLNFDGSYVRDLNQGGIGGVI